MPQQPNKNPQQDPQPRAPGPEVNPPSPPDFQPARSPDATPPQPAEVPPIHR